MRSKLLAVGYDKKHSLSTGMQKIGFFSFMALAIAASTGVGAQQSDTVVLSGVVISATKAPVSSTALTQSVTVITGEELRAGGISSVTEALRGLAGVSIASNGSYGSLTSLFLRGGESRYTKFLIDGVPVNAVGGYFDLSHLTTDNIERIEVVRGPASAVHGADAVSGAVQIFTRKGAGPLRASSHLRAGTYGTVDAGVGLSGSGDRAGFSLHAGSRSTDGIFAFNNDYLNETVSGSVRVLADAMTTISLSARGTHAESHYPTDFAGNVVDSNSFRDQRRLTLSLEAARTIRPGLDVVLAGGANYVTEFTDDLTASGTGNTRDRYTSDNRRRRVEGRVAFASALGKLSVGAEYQTERERSSSAAGPEGGQLSDYSSFSGRRTTRAAYVEQLASLGRLALTLSGRVDDPSDFERAVTYRLGGALRLPAAMTIRGSVSTAYNAPAFYHLLDTDFTTGNPALSPERARNLEISASQGMLGGLLSLGATYFHQTFEELIEYVPGGPPAFVGTYANLRAASSEGFEVEVKTAARRGWSAGASLTLLEAVVSELGPGYQGDARVGDELLRRPRRSGGLSLTWAGKEGASAVFSARHVGKRPDFDFRSFPSARVSLPSVTIADFAGSLPVVRGRTPFAVTLRVDNLFDREYQEVFNFKAPGRRVLVGGRIEAPLR